MSVTILRPTDADLVTTVLCDAFVDYPTMRFVLGPSADYDARLRTLVGFFVTARVLREDVMLGVFVPPNELAAAALVTLPGDRPPPDELSVRREAVWRQLGAEARSRYEAFAAATRPFDMAAPHHHLNMIGVRPTHAGQGHARPLLDRVGQLADEHPVSAGVTLSTETRPNVALYEHFGYALLGHAVVARELETWVFHRPRGAQPGGGAPAGRERHA